MVDGANRGNDIPLINVSQDQHTQNIQWKHLAYGWSDREIGRAMYTGVNLPDLKVRFAFRTAEEEKERVFLTGDAGYGWDGIVNNSAIPRSASAGTWTTASDQIIFQEVNMLIGGAWEATNESRVCDTLLLPTESLVALNRPMGADANRSLMEYIMANNPYTQTTGNPLMIKKLRELATAGSRTAVGGVTPTTDRRAIAYPRDQEVLRYHIPQDLTFSEPQRQAMGWVYYGTLVLGGLEIMEPAAMRYLDGI